MSITGRKRTNGDLATPKTKTEQSVRGVGSGFQKTTTSSTDGVYIVEEIEREVKDFDGCLLVVRSKFMYSNGVTAWMNWLKPGDSRIKEIK